MAKTKTKATIVHLGKVNVHVENNRGIISISLHGLSEEDYSKVAEKLSTDAVHDFTDGNGREYRNLGVLAEVTFWPSRD